jgi:hypothetical protein
MGLQDAMKLPGMIIGDDLVYPGYLRISSIDIFSFCQFLFKINFSCYTDANLQYLL